MNNTGLRLLCCNAFKNIHNKCKCVYSCKNFEQKYDDCGFKCEITTKMKRVGDVDCNCENNCIVKKSEIKVIEDSSMLNK
jgi:hypothetical protein